MIRTKEYPSVEEFLEFKKSLDNFDRFELLILLWQLDQEMQELKRNGAKRIREMADV